MDFSAVDLYYCVLYKDKHKKRYEKNLPSLQFMTWSRLRFGMKCTTTWKILRNTRKCCYLFVLLQYNIVLLALNETRTILRGPEENRDLNAAPLVYERRIPYSLFLEFQFAENCAC
jgi:hypothetical protein